MTNTGVFSRLLKQCLQLSLPIVFVAAILPYFLLSTGSLAEKSTYHSRLVSTKNEIGIKPSPLSKKNTKTEPTLSTLQQTELISDKQATETAINNSTVTVQNNRSQSTRTGVATANIEHYDSNSSIELSPYKSKKNDHIWDLFADARAVYNDYEKVLKNGETIKDSDFLIRIRADAIATISENLRAGFGIAGTCSIDNCAADFTLQSSLTGSTGLEKGQITIDEMYLHWLSDEPNRFKLAIGRMQTRSVLKTGVFNKSLDRINSNNARINWTDGIHATYESENGWASNFIMQYNSKEGSGNFYHDALDFSDSQARQSYFASFESNQETYGLTQRSIGLSYLPSALLSSREDHLETEQEKITNRDDYIGLVGKVAWLWPQANNSFTYRGGFELGYSPTTPNHDIVGIKNKEAVSGLAWNAVFNIMDIYPGHNLGINYAHTGAGWQLSPQYSPNTKLLEFRYQWLLKSATLFEARLRWQDELEATKVTEDKPYQDNQVDFYLRLTHNF